MGSPKETHQRDEDYELEQLLHSKNIRSTRPAAHRLWPFFQGFLTCLILSVAVSFLCQPLYSVTIASTKEDPRFPSPSKIGFGKSTNRSFKAKRVGAAMS